MIEDPNPKLNALITVLRTRAGTGSRPGLGAKGRQVALECPAPSLPVELRQTGTVQGLGKSLFDRAFKTLRFHISASINSASSRRFCSCRCIHLSTKTQ